LPKIAGRKNTIDELLESSYLMSFQSTFSIYVRASESVEIDRLTEALISVAGTASVSFGVLKKHKRLGTRRPIAPVGSAGWSIHLSRVDVSARHLKQLAKKLMKLIEVFDHYRAFDPSVFVVALIRMTASVGGVGMPISRLIVLDHDLLIACSKRSISIVIEVWPEIEIQEFE
jgi:hypothetical protein